MPRIAPVTTDFSYLNDTDKADRTAFLTAFKQEYAISKQSDLLLLELAADLYIRARAINRQEQQTGKFYLSARHDPVDKLVSILTSLNATPHSQPTKQAVSEDEQSAKTFFMEYSNLPENLPIPARNNNHATN